MELSERYYRWICRVAMEHEADEYSQLLRYLFTKDYRYTHPRDANRESDGIDLRYRFGYLHGIALPEVTCELDDKPCSLLEMMVALAIRCEENIMRSFDIGDRTHIWFTNMLDSLGIAQNDHKFNREEVDQAVENFFNRNYAPNGKGGLFCLKHPYEDLRKVEIWDQAMWWIDERLNI